MKAKKYAWLVAYRCQAIDHMPDTPFDKDSWKIFLDEEAAKKYSKKWDEENTCYTWSEVIKLQLM